MVAPAQGRVENKDLPVQINRDVDILFLIDDSPSMADKQKNLADNFPNFIKVLSSIQGGLPSVHIGVATSDMGTRGANGSTGPGIGTLGAGGCANAGKNGVLQTFGAMVTGGNYISDIDDGAGGRTRNYDPAMNSLEQVFATMAKAGAGGCGFEQHLEAMKQALTQAGQTSTPNSGFLRKDAFLAVVIIADEDDCSIFDPGLLTNNEGTQLGALQSFRCTQFGVICDDGGNTTATMKQVGTKGRCHPNDASAYLTKVNDYVTFLKGLKDDPNKVIVAGIIGPTTPFSTELRAPTKNGTPLPALAHSCTYNGAGGATDVEVADPPVRLKFFLDQFPNRSTFTTICQQDLSGGLTQIGDLLKAVIGDPCIEGNLADGDPNTAGVQPDCSVSQVQNINTSNQKETLLPQCVEGQPITPTTPPCWHLQQDLANCANTPSHLTLTVENKDQLSNDTHVVANCVTEVTNN
ncbi:MAG TPA: hypothetical protein VFP84_23685 [Kofleriaceae bacterium]|nr:hypothetical protein [Kofleriaceae bacterium]